MSPPPIVRDQGVPCPSSKPIHLGLSQARKKRTSQDSNPTSPNVTVTPADDGSKPFLQLCDSGNNSMTGSDGSTHSAQGEALPDSPMINLDSPVPVTTESKGSFDFMQVAEFDPLSRQSISHDSLLFDQASTNDSPRVVPMASPTPSQTAVTLHRQPSQSSLRSNQGSPRDSIITDSANFNIARPRPRVLSAPIDPHFPVSAPSSRSQSPRLSRVEKCPNSPTGSIKSQQYYCHEDDYRPVYQADSNGSLLFAGDDSNLFVNWFDDNPNNMF